MFLFSNIIIISGLVTILLASMVIINNERNKSSREFRNQALQKRYTLLYIPLMTLIDDTFDIFPLEKIKKVIRKYPEWPDSKLLDLVRRADGARHEPDNFSCSITKEEQTLAHHILDTYENLARRHFK